MGGDQPGNAKKKITPIVMENYEKGKDKEMKKCDFIISLNVK